MPVILPTLMAAAAEVPQQSRPWVWLWEITVQRRNAILPAVVLRIASAAEEVVWQPPTLVAPTTWYPMQFEHGEIATSRDGDLPAIDMTIDNTSRTLMRYLHDGDGFEGNPARLYLLHQDTVDAESSECQAWEYVINEASASDVSVSLRLGVPTNFFNARTPPARFVAQRCRLRFGGPECGYPITPVAAFTTCDHSVANCIERGDDEVARRLPRLHPQRYGGFPGIPVQRAL